MFRNVPACSGMFHVPCSWFYRRPIIKNFTGPARICDVTMSRTCMDFRGAREIKAVIFLTFSFISARFGRFACFGRFGGFVSVVSLVLAVSFRPFRFVVSGFSTPLFTSHFASSASANILNIFMGKLFKQNFLYLFVRRTIYSGESQFKTSTIFEVTVFNAAISLLYS